MTPKPKTETIARKLLCKHCSQEVEYTILWDSDGKNTGRKRPRAKCSQCKRWIKRLRINRTTKQMALGVPPQMKHPELRSRLQRVISGQIKSHLDSHPKDRISVASLMKRLLGSLTATDTIEDIVRLAQEEAGVHYDTLPNPKERAFRGSQSEGQDEAGNHSSGDGGS